MDPMSDHYAKFSTGYTGAVVFYTIPGYNKWYMDEVGKRFRFEEWAEGGSSGLKVIDIGGGNGFFTQDLAEKAGLLRKGLCVDPSKGMLVGASQFPKVETMCMDALQFSQVDASQMFYSHAMMKEMVHHQLPSELLPTFQGIFRQLTPGGSVCVTTRLKYVDFPMFSKAKEVRASTIHSQDELAAAMRQAGFDVTVSVPEYEGSVVVKDWLEMVKGRCWSIFSRFNDEEIKEGIAELEEEYKGQERTKVVEKMVFVMGYKPKVSVPVTPGLSPIQMMEFQSQGFYGPLKVLNEQGLQPFREAFGQIAKAVNGENSQQCCPKSLTMEYPWLKSLVSHPMLLEAVGDACGCHNLLCHSIDIDVGSSGAKAVEGWQRNSTRVRMSPEEGVTAWVALPGGGAGNWELKFLPGSQAHTDAPNDGGAGQVVSLASGEICVSDIRVFHNCSSTPSDAQQRGVVIHYVPAYVVPNAETSHPLLVVRGMDTFGHCHLGVEP